MMVKSMLVRAVNQMFVVCDDLHCPRFRLGLQVGQGVVNDDRVLFWPFEITGAMLLDSLRFLHRNEM
jgi:hypothetical protein